MAVPFALGRVIDIIYTKDSSKMRENLNKLCLTLSAVFVVGAMCNFGRVYLMNVSGKEDNVIYKYCKKKYDYKYFV